MTQMLQQNLNVIGCHYSRCGSISSAFSTTKGVIGGAQFVSITNTGTGIYKVQLKNIYTSSPLTTLTTGGVYSFLYNKNILGVSARVQFGALTTTPIGTAGYYTTNVVVDSTNSWILVYVYNYSAALADIPSTAKLYVDIIIGGLT